MEGSRDGQVAQLEEHHSDHKEDEDDVYARYQIRVNDVIATGLLPSGGMNQAAVRLDRGEKKN